MKGLGCDTPPAGGQTQPDAKSWPQPQPALADEHVLALLASSHLFGSERANIEAMRALKDQGADITFLTHGIFGKEHIEPYLDLSGFSWHRAAFGYLWTRHMLGKHFSYFLRNLYGVAATSMKLRRLISSFGITVLHVPNIQNFSYIAPVAATLNIPIVMRAGDELPANTPVHRWLVRRAITSACIFVAVSEYIRDTLIENGVAAESIHVIYNHPPRRSPSPGTTPDADFNQNGRDTWTLTFIGQLSPAKGAREAIEAVARLKDAGYRVRLKIAGSAEWGSTYGKQLLEYVKVKNLTDDIELLGFIEDIPGLLAKTDLHVCPSTWNEPLSNVVPEAKIAGAPSIVFPRGGLPELIHHRIDGSVCADITADALYTEIAWWLDRPEALKAARQAARQDYENRFNYERFKDQWRAVYADVRTRHPLS